MKPAGATSDYPTPSAPPQHPTPSAHQNPATLISGHDSANPIQRFSYFPPNYMPHPGHTHQIAIQLLPAEQKDHVSITLHNGAKIITEEHSVPIKNNADLAAFGFTRGINLGNGTLEIEKSTVITQGMWLGSINQARRDIGNTTWVDEDAVILGSLTGDGINRKHGQRALLAPGDSKNFHGRTEVASGLYIVGSYRPRDFAACLNGPIHVNNAPDKAATAQLAGNGFLLKDVTVEDGTEFISNGRYGSLNVEGNLTFKSGGKFTIEICPTGKDPVNQRPATPAEAQHYTNLDPSSSFNIEEFYPTGNFKTRPVNVGGEATFDKNSIIEVDCAQINFKEATHQEFSFNVLASAHNILGIDKASVNFKNLPAGVQAWVSADPSSKNLRVHFIT
jgi:hypothetical protein